MTLGGYDMEEFAVPGQNSKFHNIVPDSYYWKLTLQSVTLSNSVLTLAKERNIIVDSGTSYLTMNIEDRIKLVKMLETKGLKCFFDQQVVVCTSPAFDYMKYYPDLTLHIDGEQYFIPKQSYIKTILHT